MFDHQFYPTPADLAVKMISKVKNKEDINEILDPEAGRGDLLDAWHGRHHRYNGSNKSGTYAIEIERDLRSILRGKNYTVLDNDFLAFSAPDKFDLILMNPPFADGDKHLHKAIDIMYCGQIVCLLNAETLRNPCTMARRQLSERLTNLDAEVEYLQGAFEEADRKTGVEVALIYINIERKIEEDLFADCKDTAVECQAEISDKHEVTTGKRIEDMVAEFNEVLTLTTETILAYYKNYNKVGKYIGLNKDAEKYSYRTAKDLTSKVKATVNDTVRAIRKDYWRRSLDLREVKQRMTKKRLSEFEELIKDRANLDFTASNIRGFLLNLIAGYDDTLTQAVLEVFDRFTVKHCWDEGGVFGENVHYFNGWKTNKAFKVGKKVIIPCHGGYNGCGPFINWANNKQWQLDSSVERELIDIDVVMNYFDGCPDYTSISDAMKQAFSQGQSRNIRSTYFTITAYKKGTLHLTFNDENICRRFNVAACRGKGWLPMNYGERPYSEMNSEERSTVDTFEDGGAATYTEHLGQAVFEKKWSQQLLLEAS